MSAAVLRVMSRKRFRFTLRAGQWPRRLFCLDMSPEIEFGIHHLLNKVVIPILSGEAKSRFASRCSQIGVQLMTYRWWLA